MAGFNRVSILKVLELILACVCIGLHYHSPEAKDLHSQIVIVSTFGGFVIILAGVFAGILAGQPMPKRVDMFFSLAGVCLFVASGVLSIEYFNNQVFNTETNRIGIAKGSMAIVNGVVFLFDLIFTFRD